MQNLLVFILFLFSTVIQAEEADIRYRAIVYFYPDSSAFSADRFTAKYSEFTVKDKFSESVLSPELIISPITEFQDSYPVPDDGYLRYFGHGFSPEKQKKIRRTNQAVILDVAYPKKWALKGNLKFNKLLYSIANGVNGAIWDSETRELFTPKIWKQRRIDGFSDAVPDVSQQIVIHAYDTGVGLRSISLGMLKFGLPDIVVTGHSKTITDSIGDLINFTAQSLVEGTNITDDWQITLNVSELHETDYKRSLQAGMYENALGLAVTKFTEAKWEEGDPYNFLLQVNFDQAEGDSLGERQESFINSLFGWHDEITYVSHNEEILAASRRAKAHLNHLRDIFNSGMNAGEYVQVKAPFTTSDNGTEWMWVEVVNWDKTLILGTLQNVPYNVPDLRVGSEVTVNQQDVFDYLHYFPDGSVKGNETGELIMKYQ